MSWTRITDLSEEQKDDLHRLYQNEWWTKGRKRDDIEVMLDESDEIVAFCDSATDELVAFARVLTDYAYKALVFDVLVDPERRGAGLGKEVMGEIVDHPDLAGVEHVELYCLEEMVAFYEQWEFDDESDELRLMRREQ